MGNREPAGWPENLFIKHARIFLPVFRYSRETEQEVKGIIEIFEQFKVPKGSRILDVPCGVGRHAIPLARRGYNVTGVDFSPVFIARARANARKQKVAKRTNFYVGDMRSIDAILAEEKPFNAIISLWSSIGYYGKEEDLRMFTTLKTVASPSCLLVVDNVNRDFLVLHPRDAGISNLGRYQLHETPKLDLETSTIRNVWRFYEKRGRNLRLKAEAPFTLRAYSLHELMELLERAGWHYRKSYGDFQLQPFSRESRRIIACSQALH